MKGRCESCKHWEVDEYGFSGTCEHITDDYRKFQIVEGPCDNVLHGGNTALSIETGAEFGCVLWEEAGHE